MNRRLMRGSSAEIGRTVWSEWPERAVTLGRGMVDRKVLFIGVNGRDRPHHYAETTVTDRQRGGGEYSFCCSP